jgi:hypothetical protein
LPSSSNWEKQRKPVVTELGRATGFDLGAIVMPKLELSDFGCWRRAGVKLESRSETGFDAGRHPIDKLFGDILYARFHGVFPLQVFANCASTS